MSASVMWRPVKNGKRVGSGPLRELLENAFEQWPLRLNGSHADALAMLGRVETANNIKVEIQNLIDAVEEHGEIEVWAEY